jgi:YVTN family beta-propeller protein
VTTPPQLKPAFLVLPLLLTGCHRPNFPGYPDGFRQFAYVANSGGNTVTVLDLVYLRLDRTLRVGENPVAIVTNPKKSEAYILNRQPDSANGSISIIDTTQNQVVATIPVQHEPTTISVDPTGTSAYIANSGSNTITVLDLTARRTLVTVHTPDRPTSALISPDGRTLVVASDTAGTVSLYSAAAIVPTTKTPLSPMLSATQVDPLRFRSTFSNCPGATSPVILPDSSKAFIACPASNQVLALSLAAAPNSGPAKQNASLLQDQALALLDVGHNPTNLTLKPDGGEIFVSNAGSGTISEISTPTNEVGSTFGIGDHPAHGIVSADNGALFISNADSISLYSIDDGKLLPSLHAGVGPDALAFSTDKEQRMLLAADRKSGDVAVLRTNSKQGPALFTILPAGAQPAAIAIQSSSPTP